MDKNFLSELDQYIQNLVIKSPLNRMEIERVINTQLAILFGELAVMGESTSFLGSLKYNPELQNLEYTPNSTVLDLLRGKVDPALILKEIVENV